MATFISFDKGPVDIGVDARVAYGGGTTAEARDVDRPYAPRELDVVHTNNALPAELADEQAGREKYAGDFPLLSAAHDPNLVLAPSGTITGYEAVNPDGQLDLGLDFHLTAPTPSNPLDLNVWMVGGDDSISGSSFTDRLYGQGGSDSVLGLGGTDSVNGGVGDDSLNGNAGNDTVSGGAGDDSLYGGQGVDSVSGNAGADIIHGDDGADTAFGGQGADSLYGGAGDDSLSGDLGDDVLFGGPGADRFAFAKGSGHDWIGDFNASEGDRIVLPAGTSFSVTSYLGQAVIDFGNGDTVGLAGVPVGQFQADWVVYA